MPTLLPASLGQFCREVSIELSPLPTLLKEWGLAPEAFAVLRESAGYKHEMTVIAQEMADLGADAGYVYRMKALSEIFIADIVNIMKDANTTTGTKVDLIKFCADMARVKQPPPQAGQQMSGPRGPSVVFHFGAGLPIKSMTLVPEGTEEIQNDDRGSGVREGRYLLPDENRQPVQGAEAAVEQMGRSRPLGFQFDVSGDAA